MNKIRDELFRLQDLEYRKFHIKVFSDIDEKTIIGIRTPELRKYAKELIKNDNYKSFLEELPHKYYDENQLHSFIISEIKDYDECINYLNKFLPYVDNWATCDQMSPKVFKKNTDILIEQITNWLKSNKTYTIRFGIGILMNYYLDNNFKTEYLKIVSNIKSKEYYVNMMIAWFFATALAKQYEKTLTYIEKHKLDPWVHNKIIQKAIESRRITEDKKEYLKSLKIK